MGTAEEQTPSKPSKATSSVVQETPTTVSPYPDWSNSMQTYYGASAAPFFAPPVASPASLPYMWGGSHPMMPPPYGTPVHYPALYPPGGVYAQPSIGMATNTTTGVEEGKSPDMKDQTSAKKIKGNSDVRDEQGAGTEKGASGSGNEGASQSAESGSEGSSDASDDHDNQHESGINKKGTFDQMLAEGAHAQSNGANGKHMTTMPTTNLNIGMDLWDASPAGVAKVKPCTAAPVPGMVAMPNRQWVQDERELKRQKRKQSNRESARRSRLRKQAECEELQRRVESLNSENSTLREELERLAAECEKLSSENESIKEELKRLCEPNIVSGLTEKSPSGKANS